MNDNLGFFLAMLGFTDIGVGVHPQQIFVSWDDLDYTLKHLPGPAFLTYRDHTGEIKEIKYSPVRNIFYVFNSAAWAQDHFDLNMTISKDGFSHSGTYTMAMVMDMISNHPIKKTYTGPLAGLMSFLQSRR